MFFSQDEETTRQVAIQKVAAGQQAENLLDFDDAPAVEGVAPSGIAAAVANTPGVNKVLTSSNPLEDLVDIFGGGGGSSGGGGGGGGNVFGGGGGFGGSAPIAPAAASGLAGLGGMGSPVVTVPAAAGSGLAGLDLFGSSSVTSPPQPAPTAGPPKPAAPASQQDDLLGLF